MSLLYLSETMTVGGADTVDIALDLTDVGVPSAEDDDAFDLSDLVDPLLCLKLPPLGVRVRCDLLTRLPPLWKEATEAREKVEERTEEAAEEQLVAEDTEETPEANE